MKCTNDAVTSRTTKHASHDLREAHVYPKLPMASAHVSEDTQQKPRYQEQADREALDLIVQGDQTIPEGALLQGLVVGSGPVQLPNADLLHAQPSQGTLASCHKLPYHQTTLSWQ